MPINLHRALGEQPRFWPRFPSPLRGAEVTARVGTVLGIALIICFLTGLLSHYQYQPWLWLPVPATPYWGYRLTQGIHVITGIACIPLILVKLWSVFHRLFSWPPVRGMAHALERLSIAVLVATSVLQLITGFLNILQFYPWPWDFVKVHYWLSFIVIGSLLLHIAVQLPAIRRGLLTPARAPAAPAAVAPDDAGPAGSPGDGLSRRGLLIAAGGGVGLVALTTAGQVLPALEPLGLLATRKPSTGPQGLPVNKTARDAGVIQQAMSPDYILSVQGPSPFELSLAELEAMPTAERTLPIACVEGWSRNARWRGPTLLELVERGGGSADSHVTVLSLQRGGLNSSSLTGGQLRGALLATHLNGERLNVDHGYPVRLIAPNRAGVLQTKWLSRIVIG